MYMSTPYPNTVFPNDVFNTLTCFLWLKTCIQALPFTAKGGWLSRCPGRGMVGGGQGHCECQDLMYLHAGAHTRTNTHYRHTPHELTHTTQIPSMCTHHTHTHMWHTCQTHTHALNMAIRAIQAQCQLGSLYGPRCFPNEIFNGNGEQSCPW